MKLAELRQLRTDLDQAIALLERLEPVLGGVPTEARESAQDTRIASGAPAPVLAASAGPQMACPQCGEPVAARAGGKARRFCSSKCRIKFHGHRQRERRQQTNGAADPMIELRRRHHAQVET